MSVNLNGQFLSLKFIWKQTNIGATLGWQQNDLNHKCNIHSIEQFKRWEHLKSIWKLYYKISTDLQQTNLLQIHYKLGFGIDLQRILTITFFLIIFLLWQVIRCELCNWFATDLQRLHCKSFATLQWIYNSFCNMSVAKSIVNLQHICSGFSKSMTNPLLVRCKLARDLQRNWTVHVKSAAFSL